VNDPVFKKHVNEWATHNGMAIGGNDGRGGTWANEKNRQQASRWAKAKMKLDRTPPSRRGGSKVPPSRNFPFLPLKASSVSFFETFKSAAVECCFAD
jgi:hypothetical protein